VLAVAASTVPGCWPGVVEATAGVTVALVPGAVVPLVAVVAGGRLCCAEGLAAPPLGARPESEEVAGVEADGFVALFECELPRPSV